MFCSIKADFQSVEFYELVEQVPLAAKTGEGIKARETCNTWQPWSLAGQDSVQSASFYKKQYPIICLERTMIQQSEALRCSLTMADSIFDETVDKNPVILKMEARLDSS